MLRLTSILSLALLATACDKDGSSDSVDPADRSASVEGHGPRWMSKLDVDGDGAISRSEAKDHPRLANHFDEIDANLDGKITEAELAAAKRDHHGEGHRGKDPAERAAKMMAKFDANGDGALVPEEVASKPHLAERFAELDADHDGKLTQQELAAMKGGPGKGHGRGHGEGKGWRGKDPAEHAAHVMAKFDANGDGALVPAEVEGKPHLAENFAAADTNKDGKVTQDELAAFVAARHGEKHGGRGRHHDGERGGAQDEV